MDLIGKPSQNVSKTSTTTPKTITTKNTLNLIEYKVGSTLECFGIGDHLLNIPVGQTLRETTNKWFLRKLRSFCKAKITVIKTERQPIEWEKIFINPTSDRRLISKTYKELKKLVIRKIQ